MKTVKAWAVLAAAAACSASAMASDECASTKKAIEAKLSARGVKNYTLTVVDAKAKVPGRTVGHCDNKKRKIVYGTDAAANAIPDPSDARIATPSARGALDSKAAAAARAASEAAAAEAKATAAANLAAEAKAAASRAAAQARSAAIEARTAAETRAAAAARIAADAQVQADAAASEAKAANEAKAAADTWAVTAAKAATEAATAASKAAADAKLAAEIKAAAQAKASAAAQKAAAEARLAASARAAADAIPVDPADVPAILAAAGSTDASPAPSTAVLPARAVEVRPVGDNRFAAGTELQYDGVYRAPVSVNGSLSWKYFRFYPDGTYITVRSAGTPEQLRQWFVREEPNNERGVVKLQGTRLMFFTTEGGAAAYDGSMEAGQVVINTKGRTGQNQHSDIYEFVRWPGGGVVPAAAAQSR